MSTKSHLRVRALTEGAMLVAAAQVLSYIKLYEFPQGGSVTAASSPSSFTPSVGALERACWQASSSGLCS